MGDSFPASAYAAAGLVHDIGTVYLVLFVLLYVAWLAGWLHGRR